MWFKRLFRHRIWFSDQTDMENLDGGVKYDLEVFYILLVVVMPWVEAGIVEVGMIWFWK